MSDFPLSKLDIRVRLFLNRSWVEMTRPAGPNVLGSDYRLTAQPITIRQGRADETARTQPAESKFVLWNGDGWLTPDDRRSGFFPDWTLNCPVWILAEGHTLFRGEASDIRPGWPEGDLSQNITGDELLNLQDVPIPRQGYAFVTVTASGILRRLGQRKKALRSSLYRLATFPTNLARLYDYFPMEDGSDATVFASGIPNQQRAPMTFDGDVSPSSDSRLEGSEPVMSVGAGNTAHWYADVQGFTDDGVIEVFFAQGEAADKPESVFRPIDVYATGSLARWAVESVTYAGKPSLFVRIFGADGVLIDWVIQDLTSDPVFFTDGMLQMRFELTQHGGNVDWALSWFKVTHGSDGSVTLASSTAGTLGHVYGVGGGVGVAPPGGVSVGHYLLHDGIPGGWLVPADVGWFGEVPRNRYFRLTGEENVPRVVIAGSIDNRTIPMGAQRPASLMDLLYECEDADLGSILGEDRPTFALRFVHRRYRYNRPPVITLDASNNDMINPFEPARDDQQTRNDVTAVRTGGASARLLDQASIDAHGTYDEQITANVASDLIVRHLAGWQLRSVPGLRYPELTIDLAIAPHLIGLWASAHQGDVVRIVNLPPQHPMGSVDLVFEGWTEELSPDSWTVTANCSQASRWQVGKYVTNRWDSRGSVLASGVDADDTTLSVTVPGIDWTVADGHFPITGFLGVYPDDEQIVITDISGSAPSQTFTVTRDHLFPRSHAAGAEVHTTPAILGL